VAEGEVQLKLLRGRIWTCTATAPDCLRQRVQKQATDCGGVSWRMGNDEVWGSSEKGEMRIGSLRGSYIGFEVMVFREVNLVPDGFAEAAAGDLGGS
jgi:hypothetical protein